MLDASSINGAYWVFADGMTNLEVAIRVLDVASSRLRTYRNPRGGNVQTGADTGAFLTCP